MVEAPITEKTNITQPAWYVLLRIILGIILFWKGIVFIRDTELLKLLIGRTGIGFFSKYADTLSFIVAYLSLLCGLFISCGLFTRTSSIIQIPILFIAVFFINTHRLQNTFELVLSVITLILLIFFAIKGSGTLSADEYFRTYYKAGSEEGNTKRFFEKL
jgi:putative oxidoreductase